MGNDADRRCSSNLRVIKGHVYLVGLVQLGNLGYWDEVIRKQFKAAVGVPLSALTALCLVLLLRATSGPIKFKALGFEFEGASGPIVMWILVFLSLIAGISTLWTD